VGVFRYIAFDAAGKRYRGLVEAHSPEEAREKLRAQRLFASKVSSGDGGPAQAGRLPALRALFRRDRSAELALPLRELATLLAAGVPLAQALHALANESESGGVGAVLRGVRERVLRGESLSEAAAGYPGHFGPVARNMMAAGEASGDLEGTLGVLSEGLLRRRELAGKVTSALVYPGVLALISLAVVVFLLSYVVPRISDVYLETGAALPVPTRMLLAVSGWFESYWMVAVLATALVFILLHLGLRKEQLAARWDRAKLGLPFVGTLFRKQCVADFAGTLCGLLKAGVPLVEGLRVTSSTLKNRVAAREVRLVADEVEVGKEVSQAVRAKGVFPETLAEMMGAGEESGEMVELLEILSRDYQHQVEAAAERACRALEPLVVVLMGGVVLFIVLSVLLPIVRMSQLVRF